MNRDLLSYLLSLILCIEHCPHRDNYFHPKNWILIALILLSIGDFWVSVTVKVEREVGIREGYIWLRDRESRETSDCTTSFFATVMGSCAHFIMEEGIWLWESRPWKHVDRVGFDWIFVLYGSNYYCLLWNFQKSAHNCRDLFRLATFYTNGCYDRNLNRWRKRKQIQSSWRWQRQH